MTSLIHHVRAIPVEFSQLKPHEASSSSLTPMQYDRFTISSHKYEKFKEQLKEHQKQFPDDQGASYRVYDVTSLGRSETRINDQLLPSPPHEKMNQSQIDLSFPAEHPQSSHVSRLALFPQFNRSPDHRNHGDPRYQSTPLESGNPANAFDVRVLHKTKGAPYRLEVQANPLEGEKRPLEWVGDSVFEHLIKSNHRQQFYPTPVKTVHPNLRRRSSSVSARTSNCLKNIEREQQVTTYDYNFTGAGSCNKLAVDDHEAKTRQEIANGSASCLNAKLEAATTPRFSLARPLEGRRARILQQRRPLVATIRYPSSAQGDSSGSDDVMDEGRELSRSAIIQPQGGASEEWAKMQLDAHQEKGLEQLRSSMAMTKSEAVQQQAAASNKQEKSYLQVKQEMRNQKFTDIEEHHRTRALKLKHEPKGDLQQLRHKVDQLATREQPLAVIQHRDQLLGDAAKFERDFPINGGGGVRSELDSNNLKFSTERITDHRDIIGVLQSRQLGGYESRGMNTCSPPPLTDPPRHSHAHSPGDYVTKTNPWSLSCPPAPQPSDSAPGRGVASILKIPGCPTGIGASKSITFNEVVQVSASETGASYVRGDDVIKPLKKGVDGERRKLVRRSSEPSIYRGISLRGAALRPSTSSDQPSVIPTYQQEWRCSYDGRSQPICPNPGAPNKISALLEMQQDWKKSDAHRRFHNTFPESAPDLRMNLNRKEFADNGADLRLTHSVMHRERRHYRK